MKIVSWNVNGIRAVLKKGFLEWLDEAKPDVLMLQETKADVDSIPEEIRNVAGYHTFWHSCERKKGYSGVGILTREKPDNVISKIGVEDIDNEGRILEAQYGDLSIYGVYFPNGSTGNSRVPYKLAFYDALFARCAQQRKEGRRILVGGDYNTAHFPIDLARPKENEKTTGFLPEERVKLDELVAAGWIDTFREFHPEEPDQYTYWDYFTKARERNVGWRIDYHWITDNLQSSLRNAWIAPDVLGSDHCPVGAVIV
ncbi:MAG TPA: exodeoxyribonuclease III [Bacteroidetes bacterium]|nr:exodeoxyribonuclease III [Bacteroidota bacterium]HRK04183.1 exodeoxyribonuclease III [Chlorobiota bacterium]